MATLPTDLLQNFSEEALLDELRRREKASAPQTLLTFSPGPIIIACWKYIEFLTDDDFSEDERDDYEHDIFEAAMEATYGKDVWGWINERLGQ